MKFTHAISETICLVSTQESVVSAEEIREYCLDMITTDPIATTLPNIWDLTKVEISGDLSDLRSLYFEIAPIIDKTVKVAFVTDNILTAAISKYYSEMYRSHKYLHFETFKDLRKAISWAEHPWIK